MMDHFYRYFPTMGQALISPPHSHDPAMVFRELFSKAPSHADFLKTDAALHLADLVVYMLNRPEHQATAMCQIGGVDDWGPRWRTCFYLEILLLKHLQSPNGPSLDHLEVTLHPDAPASWTPWRFAFHTILAMYPKGLEQARFANEFFPHPTFFASNDALQARLSSEAADPASYSWTMPTTQLLLEELLPINAKWVCRDLLKLSDASPQWKRDLVPVAFRDTEWSDDESLVSGSEESEVSSLASFANTIIEAAAQGSNAQGDHVNSSTLD
ncbi:hypothetical protein H9P43_008383 [Blastocladiella emersonii ATCC 22665]|nr:hypothetical protein H9P43_008383 [Blastocladiella emersonii ATCC 22665]